MEKVSDGWDRVDDEIKLHFRRIQERMIELGMSQSWPSREFQEESLAETPQGKDPNGSEQQKFVPAPPLQPKPEEIRTPPAPTFLFIRSERWF